MTTRPVEWLDRQIRWLHAVVNVLTNQPSSDPDQAAQDAKDLPAARKWLAELEEERSRA